MNRMEFMVSLGTLGMFRPSRGNKLEAPKLNIPWDEEFDYVMPKRSGAWQWSCPQEGHSSRTVMFRKAIDMTLKGHVMPDHIPQPQALHDAEKGEIVKCCIRGGQEAIFAEKYFNVRKV